MEALADACAYRGRHCARRQRKALCAVCADRRMNKALCTQTKEGTAYCVCTYVDKGRHCVLYMQIEKGGRYYICRRKKALRITYVNRGKHYVLYIQREEDIVYVDRERYYVLGTTYT